MQTKKCITCQMSLALDMFHRSARNKSGVQSQCKACIQRYHRQRTTGGTWDTLWATQAGQCALCSEELGTDIHVDHDHVTGKVRGLLCRSCNVIVGLFEKGRKISNEEDIRRYVAG